MRSLPAFFNINHGMGRPAHAEKIPRPIKNMQINPIVRLAKNSLPRLRTPNPFIKQATSEDISIPPVRIKFNVLS